MTALWIAPGFPHVGTSGLRESCLRLLVKLATPLDILVAQVGFAESWACGDAWERQINSEEMLVRKAEAILKLENLLKGKGSK